jgi:hypothetical protein
MAGLLTLRDLRRNWSRRRVVCGVLLKEGPVSAAGFTGIYFLET